MRDKIITILDVELDYIPNEVPVRHIDMIAGSLCVNLLEEDKIKKIDEWFKNCIHSLFYKPNHTRLILVGPQNIGKTQFFRMLLPDELKSFYSENSTDIYNKFIDCDDDFSIKSSSKKKLSHTGFKVLKENAFMPGMPVADKRLINYCGTRNHSMKDSPRHNICIEIESINIELYNSIDKLKLWQELFAMYKL